MGVTFRYAKWLLLMVFVPLAALRAGAQGGDFENAALLQFQRAADSYAFAHRSHERRSAPLPLAVEGVFFTPQASAAFRERIRIALAQPGCDPPETGVFEVPRVNMAIDGTGELPPCIAAALPKLPSELEYRTAGVSLVLADVHLYVVVDVLHAAFP